MPESRVPPLRQSRKEKPRCDITLLKLLFSDYSVSTVPRDTFGMFQTCANKKEKKKDDSVFMNI